MGEVKFDNAIDIRGLVCPMTFVRAKLAIEDMEQGEVLKVTLDYPEALRSIPKSMKELGHETLCSNEIAPGQWELYIRKGAR